MAHVRFRRRKWVHTRLCSKDRTQWLTRRNRGRFGRGRYYYPRSVPHVSETLRGLVSERQTLPLLGLGRGCSQRTQRACGTAMRLCMSLFRGVEAPLSCVAFFRFCRNYGFHTLRSGLSVCARRGGVSLPSVRFACCRNAGWPLVKKANLPFSRSDMFFIDSGAKYSFIWARHSNGETVESPTSYSSTGRTMREQYRCVSISRPE